MTGELPPHTQTAERGGPASRHARTSGRSVSGPASIPPQAEAISRAGRSPSGVSVQAAQAAPASSAAEAVPTALVRDAHDSRTELSGTCLSASRLSPRERELVTLVAQGLTDAAIGTALFISLRTVRSHLDRIRDKTGCRRRADLTRLALADASR